MPLMGELDQAIQNRQQIADVKRRYLLGEISREQAKVEAQAAIERINTAITKKTYELNKKYKMQRKPALVDFIGLMR